MSASQQARNKALAQENEKLRADLAAANREREELIEALGQVTLDEMGGMPDLFAPRAGWGAWDERVNVLLTQNQEGKK